MWQQLEHDFLWENVTQLISPNVQVIWTIFPQGWYPPAPTNCYRLEPSNVALSSLWGGASSVGVCCGKREFRAGRLTGGVQANGTEPLEAALKTGFHVNIRRFIALTRVTSSTRMKSSIPPGKTNLRSRESIRPIEGLAYPLISSL